MRGAAMLLNVDRDVFVTLPVIRRDRFPESL